MLGGLAGDESQPQSRAGAGVSSRGGELLPRSRGDALSDSWLGGGEPFLLLRWRQSGRFSKVYFTKEQRLPLGALHCIDIWEEAFCSAAQRECSAC